MIDEKQPLIRARETPRIAPLRDSEIPKAVRSWTAAFDNDPLQRYIRLHKKPTGIERLLLRGLLSLLFCIWKRRKIMLTISSGDAIVFATTPELSQPSGIVDRIFDWLSRSMPTYTRLYQPAGATKRRQHAVKKMAEATERILGDRVKNMVHVDGLGTNPAAQGKGYGGALLDAITSKADEAGQASYLESSNIANTAFYMSHGFMPVADVLAGDDDPEWTEPPVVVKLMVREVRERPQPQHDVGTI